MEDNIMTNVNENVEEIETVDETPEEMGENVDLVKVVVGLGAIVVAGVGAVAYKNRDKLEKWMIKKLEKKGYHVAKIEVVDNEVEDNSEEDK